MKKLVLIMMLFTVRANAFSGVTFLTPDIGQCMPAQIYKYKVFHEIEPGTYLLQGDPSSSPYGALKTSTRFKNGPISGYMKFVGTKNIDLGDGFPSAVDFWTDCQ